MRANHSSSVSGKENGNSCRFVTHPYLAVLDAFRREFRVREGLCGRVIARPLALRAASVVVAVRFLMLPLHHRIPDSLIRSIIPPHDTGWPAESLLRAKVSHAALCESAISYHLLSLQTGTTEWTRNPRVFLISVFDWYIM
jgi:hypothetical protein